MRIQARTIKDITKVVRRAIRSKKKLRVVSTGMNWGYDASGKNDNVDVLDLSKMNKIIEYNEELGYVRIEPGVTFIQLYEFLRKHKSKLTLSTTGASMYSSVMASILERGLGKGMYGKRIDYCSDFEIVLPSATVIRSGFGSVQGAISSAIVKEGVGPDISGLFTQSDFGIVTKMTVWLSKQPAFIQSFGYYIQEKKLKQLIDKVHELKQDGILPGNFLILNDYRMLANRTQYPWELMKGKTPLSKRQRELMKKQFNIKGNWYGEGVIYGFSKDVTKLQKDYIQKTLSSFVENLQFSETVSRTDMDTYYKLFAGMNSESVPGIPTEAGLRCMYWRKKQPMPRKPQPVEDKCGVFWVSPAVPFSGREVQKAITIMEPIFRAYSFEPNFAINCATERAVFITAAILFDQESRHEYLKAKTCSNEMIKSLVVAGYPPYRLSSVSGKIVTENQDKNYRSFIKLLKKIVDPQLILGDRFVKN